MGIAAAASCFLSFSKAKEERSGGKTKAGAWRAVQGCGIVGVRKSESRIFRGKCV
jgi:hypothetical protein